MTMIDEFARLRTVQRHETGTGGVGHDLYFDLLTTIFGRLFGVRGFISGERNETFSLADFTQSVARRGAWRRTER